MVERDLANYIINASGEIVKYGANKKKEYLLDNIIPH